MADSENLVFVISQIGAEDSPIRKRANVIFEHIVTPVARDLGLRPDRSDRDPTPGPVTSRILRSILDSSIVVADLTGRNPNVYHELCFAHSFGKPVVILVDKVESLSFDVKNEAVIEIHDEGRIDMEQGEKTKSKLQEAFKVVLKDDYQPQSLVTEAAAVQNIERLSPDNPLVSELASLRRLVERTYSRIGSQTRRPPYSQDLRVLVNLVKRLAENGRLQRSELEDLITEDTTEQFDAWVNSTQELVPPSLPRREVDLSEEDFEDIPF